MITCYLRHLLLAAALSFITKASLAHDQLIDHPPNPSSNATHPDCGVMSTYYLLNLNGISLTAYDIDRTLPIRTVKGRSLHDIYTFLRKQNLTVSAVQLPPHKTVLDRTMLLFFDHGSSGHYITVRPIGHKDQLVQVLDGFNPPEVTTLAELETRPGWTGIGLACKRSPWVNHATLVSVVLFLTGLLCLCIAHNQNKR